MIKRFFCFLMAAVLGAGLLVVRVQANERFLANYAQRLFSTNYNNFPGDEANAVLQTRDGFLWFGTYNGLLRFDGEGFTVWNALSPNGFGSSSIRALYEDARGVLWIGTNDRGIVAFENGVFTVFNQDGGLPSNSVRTITGDGYGRVWGGTADGIFYINEARQIVPVALDTQVRPFAMGLAIGHLGYVFVTLNSGEVYILTPAGETIRYEVDIEARSVIRTSNGRIVVGANQGRVHIMGSHVIDTPLDVIDALFECSNGFVWLLARNGIGFLDADDVFHDMGNPNNAGFFRSMWEDYQGGFWFTATRGGIVQMTPSAFTQVDSLTGIIKGPTNAIVAWGDYLFIGADSGLFIFDAEWNPVQTAFSTRFDVRIRGLLACSAGYVWIATHDDWGVVRYNPATGEYRQWLPDDGLMTERTRFVHEISGGVMVVGTALGVHFIRGDDFISAREVFDTTVDLQLPNMMVLSSAYASCGTLFLGTDGGGVYRINRYGTTRITEADGLTGGVVLRLLYDPSLHGVWAAGSPGLSFIYTCGNPDRLIFPIEKMPPFNFLDLMHDGDELILMYSEAILRTNGAALLDPDAPLDYTALNRSMGLTSLVNANAWNLLTTDGRLFFNTDRGVKIFNEAAEISPIIPNAGIAEIFIDNARQANFNERITIPRDAYRLTVELALLSFSFVDDAVLRYMLVGQDSEPGTLRRGDTFVISYTNLRGGEYTLRVWSENAAGDQGNLIEIAFFVELAWLEQTSAQVFLVALAFLFMLTLALAITQLRTRRLRKRQGEYRTIITQSLTAIANAIDAKDSYTSGHSVRVATYSVAIAKRLHQSKEFIENLYYIGLLHDVGKIGVPNEIINKPGSLTDDEYAAIKTHTTIGFEILKGITAIPFLTAGATEHHERWDGKGYATGKSGEEISLQARIISVADVYDAMSTDRAYRPAQPKEYIITEFKRCAGTQFDPRITEIAIEMIEDGSFEKLHGSTFPEK